jgi:hypothetical protein
MSQMRARLAHEIELLMEAAELRCINPLAMAQRACPTLPAAIIATIYGSYLGLHVTTGRDEVAQ